MTALIIELKNFRANRKNACAHTWEVRSGVEVCSACDVYRSPRWFNFNEENRVQAPPKLKMNLPYGPPNESGEKSARAGSRAS